MAIIFPDTNRQDVASEGGEMFCGVMQFPEKLAALIEERGTNQSRLSRQTGIAQSAISEMTRGERRPYVDQGILLARALDVTLDYLADDELDEPPARRETNREREVWRIVREIGPELAWKRLVAGELEPKLAHGPKPQPAPIRKNEAG